MAKSRIDETFVALNRTFHELSEVDDGENRYVRRRLLREKPLPWSDLVGEFRVVILSEAGTGKTAEIRHAAEELRREGKQSFFLRLEHIANDFNDAFEVGSFQDFESWLASGSEGWLLLDSVDEARLRNPGDFELAIRKLGQRISHAQQRTHVVISSRTAAWRAKTDLAHCIRHLSYQPPAVANAREDEADEYAYEEISVQTQDQAESTEATVFKIVALDDLDANQITTFAKAKGVEHVDKFLDAVERADAESFTARPQDLLELVEFWNDRGEIGSRLEIMINSIGRRLSERDPDRADARPLSSERALQGARIIAAATVLTQESTIQTPDAAEGAKGIQIHNLLPDWDERERSTLLLRPIFDEAIYGAVRFHHRSVREFLTAEWLAELLKRHTSQRKIESLLFRNQYGVDVIVPTMRPILPWLAILDDKICERLCTLAPEVLLEGGDPSKLPSDVRRKLLRDICEQLSKGATRGYMLDYSAVQRFSSDDVTTDVKELIVEHAANEEVVWLLLRMVWQGRLKDVLPEAKQCALNFALPKHARIAAFRAVRSIGSATDQEDIRTEFLNESAKLNRDLLSELLDELEPTDLSVDWLLDCLGKTLAGKPHSVDELRGAVAAFTTRADLTVLPKLAAGLNALLEKHPVIERRECEISQRFGWLISSAAIAAERLIEAHHPASIERDVLAILHKYSMSRHSDIVDYKENEFRFSALVPTWSELNRACFWYQVEKARDGLDKNGKDKLTDMWQVGIYGSFWNFDESDFDYVLKQIGIRTDEVERKVLLSLAFRLYVKGGRSRKRLAQLKKAVTNEAELSVALANYLKPPAQARQRWHEMERRYKRQSKAREAKQEAAREKWRTFLATHLDKVRGDGLKPGQINNAQTYLHDRVREKNKQRGRWTNANWKCLIPSFGENVASAYRDGAVRFWRRHRPKLRSEGAPSNSTSFATVFGLGGLDIEANETLHWATELSAGDADLACRYAAHELNGFPVWFPNLFEQHTPTVSSFLLSEIRHELSSEAANIESSYILNDVAWSGQWAWNQLAPYLYELLELNEPSNNSHLNNLLKIVQGSSMPDGDIAKLASRKCKDEKDMERAATWYSVWAGVDPEPALSALANRIEKLATVKKQTAFAMHFITDLMGEFRGVVSNVRRAFHEPKYLKQLYLLMHRFIPASKDIDRAGKGSYSPELRDYAQRARNGIGEMLRHTPGKDAYIALSEIANAHPNKSYRPWLMRLAIAKAEADADLQVWSAIQVHEFQQKVERTPNNHRDLAELANLRLLDLKDDLEDGDASVAEIVRKGVTVETEMRTYIGRELREKAFGRYNIPQEEELADGKKPDLRFLGVGFDGPVPCELKLADRWTIEELFERMENQLCGDYLRDIRSGRGFLLVVDRGEQKSWKLPGSTKRVKFDALIDALQKRWELISNRFPGVDHIEVIGIDLTKRSGGANAKKASVSRGRTKRKKVLQRCVSD